MSKAKGVLKIFFKKICFPKKIGLILLVDHWPKMARGPQVKIPRRAGGEKTPEVRWGNRPTYPTVRVSFSLRVPLLNLFHFSMRPPGFFTTVDPRSKSSSGPLQDPPPSPSLKNRQRSLIWYPRWGLTRFYASGPPEEIIQRTTGEISLSPKIASGPSVVPGGPRWGRLQGSLRETCFTFTSGPPAFAPGGPPEVTPGAPWGPPVGLFTGLIVQWPSRDWLWINHRLDK